MKQEPNSRQSATADAREGISRLQVGEDVNEQPRVTIDAPSQATILAATTVLRYIAKAHNAPPVASEKDAPRRPCRHCHDPLCPEDCPECGAPIHDLNTPKEQPAPDTGHGICTATINDNIKGRIFRCAQKAGHYDEGKMPGSISDPGGWHWSAPADGDDRIRWSDVADGATPHRPEPADATPDTADQPPAHGCTIDGQPAMPILIARAEQAEAARDRYARRADDRADHITRLIADRSWLLHYQRVEQAEAAIARVVALADRWKRNGTRDLARYADIMLAELDDPKPATPADEQYKFATTWAEYHAGRKAATDRKAATPADAEDNAPCPHCPDRRPIPRRLMDVHVAAEHGDVFSRLATSGVDTPGCDCGRDGMGATWHVDCQWGRSILDGTAPAADPSIAGPEVFASVEGWAWYDALGKWVPYELPEPESDSSTSPELGDPGFKETTETLNTGPAAPDAEPDTVTDPAWLCQQYAKAIADDDGHPWDTLPAERQESYLDNADAVMRVRDRHIEQLRQRLTLAEQVHQDDVAETERLRARLGKALACVKLLKIYAGGLDHGSPDDIGPLVASRIRRILTGLDDRPEGGPAPGVADRNDLGQRIVNATLTALQRHDLWLPASITHAVADAVLAEVAIESPWLKATAEDLTAAEQRADQLEADLTQFEEETIGELNQKNTVLARQAARAEQRADQLAAELRALQGVADADSKQLAEVDQRCDRYAATLREVLDALDRNGGVPPTETDVDRWRATLGEQPDDHIYLSTGCRHGDHAYCKNMTGLNGSKRPGECKHCGAHCICPCHTATKEQP